MANKYPPVAFYFKLSFNGLNGSVDASFKEVSGITMEMDTEEISEGGNNSFKHRVPTSVKFSNLVVKRGLAAKDSPLIDWCNKTLGSSLSEYIDTKNIVLSLLDENGDPLKSWSFTNAWPVKWSVADLNSMNNEVLIETIEFAYSYFEEVTISGGSGDADDALFGNLFD